MESCGIVADVLVAHDSSFPLTVRLQEVGDASKEIPDGRLI